MVRLQREPISIDELVAAVRGDEDGAVATFLGVVRNHNAGRRVLHLEYEAYEGMAESEMRRIEDESLATFEVSRVAIAHRTGRLEIGEASVAVAVSAHHRGEAIDACRLVIDTLKRTVPIWKREFFEGGSVWIEGPGDRPRGEGAGA